MAALPHQQGAKVNVPIVPQRNVIDEDCAALPFLHVVKVNEQIAPCSSGFIDEDFSALPFLQHVKVNKPIVPVARASTQYACTSAIRERLRPHEPRRANSLPTASAKLVQARRNLNRNALLLLLLTLPTSRPRPSSSFGKQFFH